MYNYTSCFVISKVAHLAASVYFSRRKECTFQRENDAKVRLLTTPYYDNKSLDRFKPHIIHGCMPVFAKNAEIIIFEINSDK